MKVIAFAASSSKQSINRSLVTYAARLLTQADVEILDINDYELPLFSIDREVELGQPQLAHEFYAKISTADAVIIAFAEHNGSYTAAYKNLFDWVSRINIKVFQNKPCLLLSTSPGPGGAANVLSMALNSAVHFGMDVKSSLSVPSFNDNFDLSNRQISHPELDLKLEQALQMLTGEI